MSELFSLVSWGAAASLEAAGQALRQERAASVCLYHPHLSPRCQVASETVRQSGIQSRTQRRQATAGYGQYYALGSSQYKLCAGRFFSSPLGGVLYMPFAGVLG